VDERRSLITLSPQGGGGGGGGWGGGGGGGGGVIFEKGGKVSKRGAGEEFSRGRG